MKINIIIYSFVAALLFMSCSESYNEDLGLFPTLTPRYLCTSTSTLNYTSEESEQEIHIHSFQTPWKLENTIEWISLSLLSGNNDETINVGVSENLDADLIRTGVFYLQSDVDDWEYEFPVSVTQAEAKPSILLSKDNFDFSGASHSSIVDVSANCNVNVRTDCNWIIANYEENKIVFSITSNETQNYRKGLILLTNSKETLKKTITISQAPASITASTESLVFNNTASEVEITIDAESSWEASTSNSWIEISPTSGKAGENKMKINVAPNTAIYERKGNVILSVGGTQRILIPVRQRGIFIEVENLDIQYSAAGETASISVLSNTSWKVTSIPEWISIDKDGGEGNGFIKATASENPNTTSRSGQIHIGQEGLSIDCIVSVTQTGKTFEINSTVLNFEDKASSQTVNIESDGTWHASSDNDWITVTPPSASGNSSLSVFVTENTSDKERQGRVSVRLGDKLSVINVVQKGKFFTVDNSMLTIGSNGGNIDIAISTNDVWTAKVEGDLSWLKLSATTGNGTAKITATAQDNPSVNKRTAAIVVETVNHQSVRIIVTQKSRYLTVNVNEVLFYFKGGDSEPITVSTDGQYKVTNSDNWFTTSVNNNRLVVSAQENKTTEPRFGFITLELTDLVEGTLLLKLRVTQLNYGGSFIIRGFNPDESYDNEDITMGELTITPFGDEKNWDTSSSGNISLRISTYKSDQNWDTSGSSGLTVNRTGYVEDQNYDESSSTSGDVSRDEYQEDKNWN